MKVALVVGTRPEIIKVAPIYKELKKQNVPFKVYFTGQHYSDDMGKQFFEELEFSIDHTLIWKGLGSCLNELMIMLKEDGISHVIVQGDTNSVLAGAVAAKQLGLNLIHIEAGLRSNDRRMIEEHNRIMVDHISDYLFVPSKIAKDNLTNEGIYEGVFNVGNTIVDAVKMYRNKSKLHHQNYALVTIHRAENVDFLDRLTSLLLGLFDFKDQTGLKLVMPIHPRTANKLKEFGIWDKVQQKITFIEPVGFCDMLSLEKNAKIIFTDSGGVQEEACILGRPCVTLRLSTERPETVAIGANLVTGYDSKLVVKYGLKQLKNKKRWVCPYGDGKTSQKVVKVIKNGVVPKLRNRMC